MGNSSQLGNATCNLLAKEGCVAALIKQCNAVQQKCQDVRVLALRGLSSICCVAECIREFEKVIFIQTFRAVHKVLRCFFLRFLTIPYPMSAFSYFYPTNLFPQFLTLPPTLEC